MWLSSKPTADKLQGSHVANNYMCCIRLGIWANKSQQRWVTLRKALRWRLTSLWWCRFWVLFTKSSKCLSDLLDISTLVYSQCLGPSHPVSAVIPGVMRVLRAYLTGENRGDEKTQGFSSLCLLLMWLSRNSQTCPLLNCPLNHSQEADRACPRPAVKGLEWEMGDFRNWVPPSFP